MRRKEIYRACVCAARECQKNKNLYNYDIYIYRELTE